MLPYRAVQEVRVVALLLGIQTFPCRVTAANTDEVTTLVPARMSSASLSIKNNSLELVMAMRALLMYSSPW